eukprot:5660251-Ditylum_brightwellii.AAC.1
MDRPTRVMDPSDVRMYVPYLIRLLWKLVWRSALCAVVCCKGTIGMEVGQGFLWGRLDGKDVVCWLSAPPICPHKQY